MEDFNRRAHLIRKASGTSDLEVAMRKAVKVLSAKGIPHLISGGMAVQERGYPRSTIDVDIIVPNIRVALQELLKAGFTQSKDSPNVALDEVTQVEIDLLPGGKRVLPDTPLPLPLPTNVNDEPQIVLLDSLIDIKLSAGRAKDFADVVQLIKANSLQRNYHTNRVVQDEYYEAWDMATAEQAAEGLMGEY